MSLFCSDSDCGIGRRSCRLSFAPTRRHNLPTPFLSHLSPPSRSCSVVRIDFTDATVEEYFIPGGFAFQHPNNTCVRKAAELLAPKPRACAVEEKCFPATLPRPYSLAPRAQARRIDCGGRQAGPD